MAKLKSGTRIYGTATIDTSVVVGSAVTLSSSGIQVTGISTLNNANATQLQVTGVSTFTNGPVLVGTATSTGTASQLLQVNGGAYVSTRLGVGVTNPATNTQVAIAGTLGISEVGGAGTRTLLFSSGSGFTLNHNDNSNIIIQSQGANKLQYQVTNDSWVIPSTTGTILLVGSGATTGTASQPLQVTGGGYFSQAVGIGTTNPSVAANRLSISNATGGGMVSLNDGGTTNRKELLFTLDTTNNAARIESLQQGIAYRPLLLNVSGGNIGIQTTNPTSTLTVVGNGLFSGTGIVTATTFVGGLTGTASTATTALGFSTTASINTSGIITATGGFVGTLVGIASTARNVIGGIASVTQLQVGPGITTVGFITASSLRVSGITTLGITTATNIHVSGVSTFVGESYFSNSIGIGTTNLQVELTVIGSARVGTAATYISIGGNNGRNIEIGAGTTTLDTYIDFGGSSTYTNYSARIIRGSGDGGAFSIINRGGSLRLTTQDASPILFVTSNTPRHRITGDGIFLIGTDTSTAERQVLQVAGINSSVYIGGSVGIGTIISTAKLHIGAATTSAAGGAPLKIGVGTTILATPEVGAIEYDGSYLYHTPNSTSGRAYIPPVYTFRLTDNGSPIGPSNNDVFVTPSSLSLEASSVYKISAFVYFLKTTAGTATWRQFFSNAPTIADGYHYHTPVTGMTAATSVAYTQIQQFFYNQGDTAFAWNPSATNLTTGVNHFYRLEMTVLTNAATNWRLRSTQSAGTITPLAGSYYRIEKVGPSTGSFVA